MSLAQHIRERVSFANVNPTEAQKKAGNYRKGHIKVHGLDISIENPKGSWRSGTSPDGKAWRSKLPHHYGYVRRTEGSDGDHVDVFIGPHLRSGAVYVIDQKNLKTDAHDEHKCMLGFSSEKEAVEAYCKAFSDGRGRQRIRGVEGMTMERFKDWLKDKTPVKRAAGGGVQEGPPPFEMTSEVPSFDQTEPVEPDAGKLDAAYRGAKAGATFNMGDELSGIRAAAPKMKGPLGGDMEVPEFVGPIPAKTIAGAARTAYGYATGDEGITKQYEEARDAERRAAKGAKENHPWIYAGSELAGAVPAMAALPEIGAARALAPAAAGIKKFGAGLIDAATTGGMYGAAAGAGEGEGLADRAVKAATGLVSGIVGGGIAKTASDAVGWAGQKYGAPVLQTVRGWMNPEGESARRAAAALKADNELIMAGKAHGMTPQQWAAARANGEPVTLADLGATHTQSLLRSAANTSPEARAMLEKTFGDLSDRFRGQSERVADTVRKAIPGSSGNARKTADQLVAEYDAGRVPLYQKAYEDGDKQIFTPVMDRLTGSPIFGKAMVSAISSGKSRAITEGYGAFQPPVSVGPSGNFVFNRAGPNAGPVYPNLQYWDQVKRELDSIANTGKGSEESILAGKMAKLLRNELDSQVSSYRAARGFAEEFFGEKNALEAGRKLAGKKANPEDVKAMLRQMKPDERELFKEGYASDLAERVIGNMKDTVNITRGQGIFQSPNERKLAAAIFGPGGMAQLEARMQLERVMDGARQAMGNSTTARQLIEAGLAGGAISGYASGWDPGSMMAGATGLAGARYGKTVHTGLNQVAQSAKHMIGKVDAKTAAKVADLLTSNDPRLLRQGYQMAAKSRAIMDGLKRVADQLALASQTQARQPVTEGVRALAGPMGARADEEQQRP